MALEAAFNGFDDVFKPLKSGHLAIVPLWKLTCFESFSNGKT
jgi:hypothetical protein